MSGPSLRNPPADSKARQNDFTAKGLVDRLPVQTRAQRRVEIRERYANGETEGELCADYKIIRTAMARICKGVKRKPAPVQEAVQTPSSKSPSIEKPLRDAQIRESYSKEEPVKKIAADFGVSTAIVYDLCKGMEKPIEKRNARIREGWVDGKSRDELSSEFGLSVSVITHVCRGVKRKVPFKAGRKSSPEIQARNAEIRDRYADGDTLKELAADYRLGPPNICVICKGVERKPIPPR